MPKRKGYTNISIRFKDKRALEEVIISKGLNRPWTSWDDFWAWAIEELKKYDTTNSN